MGDKKQDVSPSGASEGGAEGTQQEVSGQAEMNKGAQATAGVTEEELVKSMDKLEEIVKSSPDGRKQELLSKAMENKINEDEKVELMKLLGGETVAKSLSDSVSAQVDPGANETLQKSIDVSPYLDELHSRVSSALIDVAEHIEKSDARHQEQVVVLAKGLVDLGRTVIETAKLQKSMAEQLGVIARQPASAPRAATARVAPQTPAQPSMELSKGEVVDILTEMNMHSKDGLAKCGEDLVMAASKYEQFSQISRPLLDEVIGFKRQRMNGQAR